MQQLLEDTRDGRKIELLWNEDDNTIELVVVEAVNSEIPIERRTSVPQDKVLDALHHPYFYLNSSPN